MLLGRQARRPGAPSPGNRAQHHRAVERLRGIPSVNSGMNDDVEAALSTASGPATPSIAPPSEALRHLRYALLDTGLYEWANYSRIRVGLRTLATG